MNFFKNLMNSDYKTKIVSLFIFIGFASIFIFAYQDCSKVRFSTDTQGINGNCDFHGAHISMNPSSGITSTTSVNFSVSPAVDPGTTFSWVFETSSGITSVPVTSSTVDKTFGDGVYSVAVTLTKSPTCQTTILSPFTVSDGGTCTPPAGISGPDHGFVNDTQTFLLSNVDANCFSGSTQWEMDQEINGSVNTNPHTITKANPALQASYAYLSAGTYTVQVQVASENYSRTHEIVICDRNQIYENGACKTVCVDPITQQQVQVGSTTQGYSSQAGTCSNACHEITSTCQSSGQFNPPIYGSCTNATNCGGGGGSDFVQAELSKMSNDFSFSQPTSNISVNDTTYSYIKVKTGIRNFKICHDLSVDCNGTQVICDNVNYTNYASVNVICNGSSTGASCTLHGTAMGTESDTVGTLNTSVAGYDIIRITNTANPPNGVIGGPNCHATSHLKQNTAQAQFSYVVAPLSTTTTTCVDPITQQQVQVGSTTQGYSSQAGTCSNACHEITSTCQSSGQFNPPIYGSCTNATNCGGGSGPNCGGKTCTNGTFLNSTTCSCNCLNNRDQVVPPPVWPCGGSLEVHWCCQGQTPPWICHNTGPGPSEECK